MLDTLPPPTTHQRANGSAAASFVSGTGRVRLGRLRQQGCAKAFLPRVSGPPEVVFLNTAGGLTGGDQLSFELDLDTGVRVTATTQTAERAYAAAPGAQAAEVAVTATVAAGAHLDWLPQETILFDQSRLRRRTHVALAGDATCLLCEALVLGRAAMGETLAEVDLFDRREVLRDGRPLLVDAVELSNDVLQGRAALAGLADARAVATVALVAQGAEEAASALRGLFVPDEVRVGVSGWDGRVIIRLMAPDGWPLRVAVAAFVRHLRARNGMAGDLPRVWQI